MLTAEELAAKKAEEQKKASEFMVTLFECIKTNMRDGATASVAISKAYTDEAIKGLSGVTPEDIAQAKALVAAFDKDGNGTFEQLTGLIEKSETALELVKSVRDTVNAETKRLDAEILKGESRDEAIKLLQESSGDGASCGDCFTAMKVEVETNCPEMRSDMSAFLSSLSKSTLNGVDVVNPVSDASEEAAPEAAEEADTSGGLGGR